MPYVLRLDSTPPYTVNTPSAAVYTALLPIQCMHAWAQTQCRK